MQLTQRELFILLFIVVPILLIQGSWIFYDARKRGEKYYWLWGIFGLLNTPGNLVIYLIVTRIISKNSKK